MKSHLKIITITLWATFTVILQAENAAEVATKYATKEKITLKAINAGVDSAKWKIDKSAVAYIFKGAKKSLCLVLFKDKSGSWQTTDVSLVESGNFGKFGFGRSHYNKYQTYVEKWDEKKEHPVGKNRVGDVIVFVTQAWKNGQRYTVKEFLFLDSKHQPFWR